MLAARDQENLAYTHHQRAADKPLNNGVRGLPLKTPAKRPTKTPLKTPGNDENNPRGFGGQNTNLKKDGKQDSNAFVTPLGPRIRAPLGMKTTNAKAQPTFKTPGLAPKTAKRDAIKKGSTARKSARSKIRVAQTEPVEADVLRDGDSDVEEIERCPAPVAPLPDHPEDKAIDDTFLALQGANLCRGYAEVYDIPRDKDGIALHEHEADQKYEGMVSRLEDRVQSERIAWPEEDKEDKVVDAMVAAGPRKKIAQSKVGNVQARDAVTLLSSQAPRSLPAAAGKPTASSISRSAANQVMRHKAAVATSRTTIGYSRRSVPSILPKKTTSHNAPDKVDQSQIHPLEFKEIYGQPPAGSKMWERLRQYELLDEDDDADNLVFKTQTMDLGEDEDDIFQLPVPDEIEI